MKKNILIAVAAVLLWSCGDTEGRLKDRAAELCKYIPDHELREGSQDYMTDDFHAVLDTMFNLPSHEAMDHEWLYFFVTGNGGTIADYEVVEVRKRDKNHAVVTIKVRQKWEDGSFDEDADIEMHELEMEKVDGVWLMSDFDGHKADCICHIAQNRREEAVRDAVKEYLVDRIGPLYRRGMVCIPTLMMVHESGDSVWGDFWIYWYDVCGDTLKTVSGGSHAGLMTLRSDDGKIKVDTFDEVADGSGFQSSAQRIFGDYYELFMSMHSNGEVREAVRREQLQQDVERFGLKVRYYQDYGWPAVDLCK